jgi:hypothetical protein
MKDVPTWLNALGVLFGIIVLVAAAVAVIWSTAAQKRAEALEGTNAALVTRIDIQDKEIVRLETERKALQERVHVLEDVVTSKQELGVLQDTLITHDKRVDVLTQVIVNNHTEAMERITSNREMLNKIYRQNINTRQLLNKLGVVGKIVRPDVDADDDDSPRNHRGESNA